MIITIDTQTEYSRRCRRCKSRGSIFSAMNIKNGASDVCSILQCWECGNTWVEGDSRNLVVPFPKADKEVIGATCDDIKVDELIEAYKLLKQTELNSSKEVG